jgi:hypothetical protein
VYFAFVAAPLAAQVATPTGTPVDPTPTATPSAPTPTPTLSAPTPTSTPVDPTPTATPSTPTPTPTPTPPPAAVAFDASSLAVGQPVTASGTAADGTYCLCLVPAGVFSVGATYSGTAVACVGLTVSGNSFSGVTVLDAAPAGQYDLLMLIGPCGEGGVIAAGDSLDEGVGLVVAAAAAVPGLSTTGGMAALLLIALAGAILLWRRA